MKFDPEIARDILLDIEELHQPQNLFVFSSSDKFNRAQKYDLTVIVYHCDKLEEAGFLNWEPIYGNNQFQAGVVNDLTYQGHLFLDSVRRPKVWRETKSRAEKVGIFTLDFISQTAANVIAEISKGRI
ncbi:DUF2513 domain-containing protein [Streptococcus sobrinus]|uniref:DUF2513 domain-containing protein n=2 Tax=Streptococcus sobrinus TaxID=1310 RepID=UPI000374B7B6|nr:DUF2513 domain-containing protein [Streptococcus sobrinus]